MGDAIRIDPNTGKCVHGCFPEDCATCLGERVDLRGPLSRDSLLARLSDVLRRSGVEDAESLIVAAEKAMHMDSATIDRICFALCNAHDSSELWAHARREPDVFRAAVRTAMQRRERVPASSGPATPLVDPSDDPLPF